MILNLINILCNKYIKVKYFFHAHDPRIFLRDWPLKEYLPSYFPFSHLLE
jgi:hypothetical protein